MDERVVLVPGVGFAGAELLPMSVRLRRRGYRVTLFWHFTGRHALEESARRLHALAEDLPEETVHFVGHSLGGLVVLRMLADHPWDRPGRIVTLGTPHAGLSSARRFERVPILWPGVRAALYADPISLPQGRELGVLSGDRGLFVGRFIVRGQASDMVIGVTEAMHPDSRAHVSVSETHAGMLYAARVAAQVDCFLREGRFEVTPPA
jgi:pimeloyl-ACP methyl ester carboxylesterase